MCSIVGCIGPHNNIARVFEGLRRLEYRGYDSAGCSGITTDGIVTTKSVGGVDTLVDTWSASPFDATTCIGHTRWATHGKATQLNAHPHTDAHNTVAIVHNGIIENEHALRQQLIAEGYALRSSTDSELIAHLFARALSQHADPEQAFQEVVKSLEGAFAICAITVHAPDRLFVARHKSPMCVGLRGSCTMVASDVAGCAVSAHHVVYMPERSYACIGYEDLRMYDMEGASISWQEHLIDRTFIASHKEGYAHYMLKEIHEQKRVIRDTIDWAYSGESTLAERLGISQERMQSWRSCTMTACGTSYFAAAIGTYYIQEAADIPSYAWIASEFRYRPHFLGRDDCCMVLSQSGETADTLEALRYVQSASGTTLGMVNVPASSIEREADACLFTQAQQEVCVASTKSFTAQLALLYWFAQYLGYVRGYQRAAHLDTTYQQMMWAAEHAEDRLEYYRGYIQDTIAPVYAHSSYMIFLGKHMMYPLAQEAALKVQELAYIPSYAYPAGELKHGPLALITYGVPVVLMSSPHPQVYRKVIATAKEVQARGGTLIVYACEGQHELVAMADVAFTFTVSIYALAPLIMAPTLQAYAYYLANHLSRPIDKPRNLAKSVTVE